MNCGLTIYYSCFQRVKYTPYSILPNGLPIKNLTTTYNTPLVGGTPSLVNRYQYNGKEFETDLGLMWNDYGARWYDPQCGVWGQIDPLAEKYYGWSGYNYVMGNPIRNIDPNGMDVSVGGDTDAFISLLQHVFGEGIEARLDENNKLTLHEAGAAADDKGLTKDSDTYNNLSDKQKTVFDTFDEAIQDTEGTLNLSITDNSDQTLIGGWGETEQRIDPQDMMDFEKKSNSFVSAGALLAHEIKEGHEQVKGNGYGHPITETGDGHRKGLNMQGKTDGYFIIRAVVLKNEKGGIISGQYDIDNNGQYSTLIFGIKNNGIGKVTVTETK